MDRLSLVICLVVACTLFATGAFSCDVGAVMRCFPQDEDVGINDVNGMMNPGQLPPEEVNAKQREMCSEIAELDENAIRNCVAVSGCADTSIVPEEAEVPGVEAFTYSMIIDLVFGICEEGCENIGTKSQQTQQCSEQMGGSGGSDPCAPLDRGFRCFRRVIGDCEALTSFTQSMLDATGMMEILSMICPDVDVSLSNSNNGYGKRNLKELISRHNFERRMQVLNAATRMNLLRTARNLRNIHLPKMLKEKALPQLKARDMTEAGQHSLRSSSSLNKKENSVGSFDILSSLQQRFKKLKSRNNM